MGKGPIRRLLEAEMERAMEIMHEQPYLDRHIKKSGYGGHEYNVINPEVKELRDLFKSIRRHTIALERTIK